MNQKPRPSHASGPTRHDLVDLLDQIIDSGAVATGDVLLSVAEIDLVHLELRLALKGIDERRDHPVGVDARQDQPTDVRTSTAPGSVPGAPQAGSGPTRREPDRLARNPDPEPGGDRRTDTDPQGVQRGLAALVLTVVDILGELMERQAVRRMEAGSLAEHQVERLGQNFILLRQRMEELKEVFGVRSTHHDVEVTPDFPLPRRTARTSSEP